MITPRYQIHQGDVLDFCREYDGEPFHACLCDCPYHYSSITKRFGGENSAPAQHSTDGAFKRLSGGFMGAQWDGVDENGDGVAMKADTWEAIASVLYPGAFLFVFAGTLNDDMIALAMRQAGLIKHHSLYWIHGQGFPKSTRIKGDPAFNEHRYGRQSLKPATEVILCFQKPYKGKPVECITKTGAGALNIGAGRVGSESFRTKGRSDALHAKSQSLGDSWSGIVDESERAGRWPSNLILEKGDVAAALDAQSGQSVSNGGTGQATRDNPGVTSYGWKRGEEWQGMGGYKDTGGASRFFMQSDWQAEEYDPFFYAAKAGRAERGAGLEGFAEARSERENFDASLRDGKGIERRLICRNPHPTVKPLRLTRYLASLLLPPAEYAPRRLFVPFAGVASEMIGAHLAGWESVVGVEGQEEYCEIGEARLKFWSGNVGLFDSLTAEEETEDAQELLPF